MFSYPDIEDAHFEFFGNSLETYGATKNVHVLAVTTGASHTSPTNSHCPMAKYNESKITRQIVMFDMIRPYD